MAKAIASSINFEERLRFVEISSSQQEKKKNDNNSSSLYNILWPCVLFQNAKQYYEEEKCLQDMIQHGVDERIEASLALASFKSPTERKTFFKAIRSSHGDGNHSSRSNSQSINQTSFVYLLGRKQVQKSGKSCRPRLIFAPNCKTYLFHEKYLEAIESRQENGFAEAIEEVLTLRSSLSRCSIDIHNVLSQNVQNRNQPSDGVQEFTETMVIFVPECVPGQEAAVPWPAIKFCNWGKFCRQLKERQLLKNQSMELELDRIYRDLSEQDFEVPYAYLFGKPPSSKKMIPLASVKQQPELHGNKTWERVCPYLHVAGYWEAYTELQFSINNLRPTLSKPSSKTTNTGSRSKTPTSLKRKSRKHLQSNESRKKRKTVSSPAEIVYKVKIPKIETFSQWNIKVIPTFKEVRPILESEGYSFQDGRYNMPNCDNDQREQLLLGKHYFVSEDSFREHLCSSGIQVEKSRGCDTDPIYAPLIAWVSYYRLEKLLDEINSNGSGEPCRIDSICRLDNYEFRLLLEKLEIYWKQYKWKIPQSNELITTDIFFNGLSRNGLPRCCPIHNISQDQLLSIELFIGSCDFRRESFFVNKIR